MTCRNEENNIGQVLDSLEKQTVKPNEVSIVDDASIDDTFKEIEKYVMKNGWYLFRRNKNDERYSSIVNGMKIASSLLKDDFDFLLVLDGDTILEQEYISKILKKFQTYPELGIAGGSLKEFDNKKDIILEKHDEIFGCNRVYSKNCWFDVNGGKTMEVVTFAWDPEHLAKAKVRGYMVNRFDDISSYTIRIPSLKVSFFDRGRIMYQSGFSLTNVLLLSVFWKKLDHFFGYMIAWLNNEKKIDNKNNIKKIMLQNDLEFLEKSFLPLFSKRNKKRL